MKLFVIARSGQLGRELCKRIEAEKHTLHPYSRNDLDITDYGKVMQEIEKYRPDIVINTAAHHATLDGEANPSRLFAVNAFAIKNLAILCRRYSVKLVTFSSDYVFDGLIGRPYTETDQPHPIQYFGLSKYMGELFALNYNPQSFVIRTSGVYGGIEGSQSKRNFVLNLLNDAKTKRTIEVSDEQIVSPVYAFDLAEATMKLISIPDAKPGIYHLTNSGYCSWAEFSKEIIKRMRKKTVILPIDRKGQSGGIRRPIFSALANTRAKTLGIELPSWQDGLSRYAEYLTNNV